MYDKESESFENFIDLYGFEDPFDKLPFRESRKEFLTRKYGSMYDIFEYKKINKEKYPWNIAFNIINSNIGKSFDLSFSYYCKKVEKRYQYIFLNYFNNRRRYIDDYFVDNNGNIQKVVKYKRPKTVTFTSKDYKFEFRHKVTNHLLSSFDEVRDEATKHYYNSKVLYYQYGADPMRLKPFNERYKANIEDFKCIVLSGFSYQFTSKNDYYYKRLKGEEFKEKSRLYRLNYKLLKEKQYSFLSDSEIKLRKQKEIDKIKIVSHGFDLVTSFRNEKQTNPDLIKLKQ